MLSIVPYNECYDEQLLRLDELLFYKVKFHPDLIKDTVHIAVDNGSVWGAALLLKRGSFLAIDRQELEYHELIIEYGIAEACPQKAEVLSALLAELKKDCNRIAEQYPGRRIFIKTWAAEEEHFLIELFLNNGFIISRGTPILVRRLDSVTETDISEAKYLNIDTDAGEIRIELKTLRMNDALFAAYEEANGEAFVVADSIGDIRFKLNSPDVKIFAAMLGNEVIASVMTWNVSGGRAATENIFCRSKYRRKGITAALIDYACGYLKHEGFAEASLTVYQDNIPAIKLYEKLGYRYDKFMFGLQYEKDYTALPY